jgi:hypothetical protein
VIFLSFTSLGAQEYIERSRSDNIPHNHLIGVDDDYLTGYVQALVDMHYYEFQVRVIVIDRVAYVFDLPYNALMSYSILRFIGDVPCLCGVQSVCCSCQEFLAYLEETDECCAQKFMESTAYQSICCAPLGCRIRGIWIPQNTVLFAPFIADPRQPQNAAALRFNDNPIGHHVGAPSFGGDFIIFRWKDVLRWHGDMDFGVQAGIFAVFDLDHPEACLVNTDFFVAAMVTYAYDRLSYRFRWWHMSSHLGDEFILFSTTNCPRYNLSDEGVDFFASFQMNPAIRLYAGIGYIYSRDREFPEEPLYFEGGAEIRVFGERDCFDRLYIQPFLAMHFRTWEEHNFDIDQTYALGVEWSPIQGVGRMFRLFLEFHDGYSKEGQFVRERSDYFAIKITYGF